MLHKSATRAISSAGYNAHTEPLFKFYNVLKVEDIYNYRLLVLYYNLKHKNVPYHIASFLTKSFIVRERYPNRNSRFQPPLHAHEYIAKTRKYRFPVFLNSVINNFFHMFIADIKVHIQYKITIFTKILIIVGFG